MPKRILAVDDHPNIVRAISTNLIMEGFDVVGAYDGRTALEKARNEPPDLIILDIMMPEMDGREVLRRLKQDPQTASIPVLILTVLTQPDEIVRSLSEGAEWHLAKPFDIKELIELVKRILEIDPHDSGQPSAT